MYHHMVECPHTTVQRPTMQQIARKAVEGILAEAAAVTDDVPQLIEDVALVRRALSKGLRWDAPANRSMLFHLALAQPWSIKQVPVKNRIGGTAPVTRLSPVCLGRFLTRSISSSGCCIHVSDGLTAG